MAVGPALLDVELTQPTQSTEDGESDWIDRTRHRVERRAKDRARREGEKARGKVGQLAFDALEEYFPEQAKSRRRETGAKALLVGVAAGVLLYHFAVR